jgi:hypothetical protein
MVAGRITLLWKLLADWMNFVEWCPNVKEGFMRVCPQPVESNAKLLGMSMLRATLLTRIAVPVKQSLLYLILKTLELRCADSRDHVFAMVGIASDADTFDLIDYRTPIEKLCRKLAYAPVTDSMSVKLLWSLVYKSSHLLESMIVEKLHRRFGRTKNGRIGWLPPIAMEGDFIGVFDGMELPYAIRPAVDGQYLLVGECIIPGLMLGEAVELSGVVSEAIVLEQLFVCTIELIQPVSRLVV